MCLYIMYKSSQGLFHTKYKFIHGGKIYRCVIYMDKCPWSSHQSLSSLERSESMASHLKVLTALSSTHTHMHPLVPPLSRRLKLTGARPRISRPGQNADFRAWVM